MSKTVLDALPPELYSAILNQLPENDLQRTTLALTRAIPYAPVPQRHLFACGVILRSTQGIIQLYRRLRGAANDAQLVQKLNLESWTVDAEVVINLLFLLGSLTSLTLFVGPDFTPEHLELIFERPRLELCYISLRFRPYVQRVTYYQFLRGAYFDSTLTCLSKWPMSSLPALSITQDPLDEAIAPTRRFAQPLVFFSLEPFASLSSSPYLSKLRSLRLRIPSRNIAPFICTQPHSLPALELLDMSTCNVKEPEMEALLVRFATLKHLILDACSLLRSEPREDEWVALGKVCALAGGKRAKEREKQLKVWLEAHYARVASRTDDNGRPPIEAQGPPVLPQPANARPRRGGRRGVANATISLRRSPPRDNVDTPAVASNVIIPKIRVLPPPPTLVSLSTTSHATIDPAKHSLIRADFAQGWSEGLSQLTATWRRMKASRANNVRVMHISTKAPIPDDDALSEGLKGLTDLVLDDAMFDWSEGNGVSGCPVLCFAGSGKDGIHPEGCGHLACRKVWEDDLL